MSLIKYQRAVVYQISSKSDHFCRAMLCKRDPCRHAVSVCPAVCPFIRLSRSWTLSKRICLQFVFNFYSPSGSHTIVVFHCKRYGNNSDGNPPNGSSNARGICKNRNSRPIFGPIACCERFDRQVQYTQLQRTMAS